MGSLATRTDEALLQAAISGQETAWTELVDRYHSKGLRFVRRQIDDPYLAQDIMQNLWISVVDAAKRQVPDQFAPLYWTLLRRRLIDALRKKGRSREAAILDAPAAAEESGSLSLLDCQQGDAPDPAAAAVASEDESLLHQALGQLPDHYRLVIAARQFEGRTNKETAHLLLTEGLINDDGNTEKRVENYYYRGLKELRKQLLALGYTGGGRIA